MNDIDRAFLRLIIYEIVGTLIVSGICIPTFVSPESTTIEAMLIGFGSAITGILIGATLAIKQT